MNIAILDISTQRQRVASTLGQTLSMPIVQSQHPDYDGYLVVDDEKLSLLDTRTKTNALFIDFFSQRSQKRLQSALLKKACGLKKLNHPSVLDLTAGLGRDAFALTTFGCKVTMIERSPIIAALLADGLSRAKQHPNWKDDWQLTLINDDAKNILRKEVISKPEVIYLDPMFAKSNKTAKSKKELQLLQTLVTEQDDSVELFHLARHYCKKRLVVKRAIKAAPLGEQTPDIQYFGTTIRFDVYTEI